MKNNKSDKIKTRSFLTIHIYISFVIFLFVGIIIIFFCINIQIYCYIYPKKNILNTSKESIYNVPLLLFFIYFFFRWIKLTRTFINVNFRSQYNFFFNLFFIRVLMIQFWVIHNAYWSIESWMNTRFIYRVRKTKKKK